MARMINIFVSHSWDHLNDLRNLRNLLNNRGYFNVEFLEVTPDVAFNSNNIYYLHMKVGELIAKADIIIGLAGVYASHSDWMQWEMDKAKSLGKPILGVIPWGQTNISNEVAKRADDMCRWNTESIVEKVRKLV